MEFMENDFNNFLWSIIINLLQLGIFIFLIILVIINRRSFKDHYKAGLLVGFITLVLALPLQVASLVYLNMDEVMALFKSFNYSDNLFVVLRELIYWMIVVVAIVGIIFSSAYTMFAYTVSVPEWSFTNSSPFPILMGHRPRQLGRLGIAALVGVGLAFISFIVFRLLNVGMNEAMERQLRLFMNIENLPEALQVLFLVFFVTQAAIAEEVIFRGAILGFLTRLSKNRILPLLISIFAVSLLWAILHFFNSDAPLIKFAQVFILGTILAEFARRWSLESAIVLHVSINIGAVFFSLVPIF